MRADQGALLGVDWHEGWRLDYTVLSPLRKSLWDYFSKLWAICMLYIDQEIIHTIPQAYTYGGDLWHTKVCRATQGHSPRRSRMWGRQSSPSSRRAPTCPSAAAR